VLAALGQLPGETVEGTALELIDELITCWNGWQGLGRYYLKEHVPRIVRSTDYEWLLLREREIVSSLRRLLLEEEWRQLGALIVERQANKGAGEKARRHGAEQQARREQELDRARTEARVKARRREAEQQARLREERERQARLKEEHERQARQQRQALEAEMARKRAVIARVQHAFESDFLSADRVLAADPDATLVSGPEYQALKTRFVQDWVARTLQHPLDSEQAAAIAATEGDVQVVARAGSGKTRTLVTRALFCRNTAEYRRGNSCCWPSIRGQPKR
jgi:DNA helicase IV